MIGQIGAVLFIAAVIIIPVVLFALFWWTQSVQVRIWDRTTTNFDRKLAKLFRIHIS